MANSWICLVWNYLLNSNKTLVERSLGGSVSELYPMVASTNKDGQLTKTYSILGLYGFSFN